MPSDIDTDLQLGGEINFIGNRKNTPHFTLRLSSSPFLPPENSNYAQGKSRFAWLQYRSLRLSVPVTEKQDTRLLFSRYAQDREFSRHCSQPPAGCEQ